jgi:hypothetical protein
VSFLNAVNVAGYTVAVRGGRVWLPSADDRDGDLTVAQAEALAATIQGAARQAKRMGRRAAVSLDPLEVAASRQLRARRQPARGNARP